MRLFAEQGFGATSVADIETAVGLQPRRGALYKHFENKQDLLETGVQACLDDAAAVANALEQIGLAADAGDPSEIRPLVIAVGRGFLDAMDRLEELTRVLEHDARRLRALTAAVKADVVDMSYRSAARVIAAVAPHVPDAEAAAVVALGSLVAARRTLWTFGSAPLSVTDARLLGAWADTMVAAMQQQAAAT
jgi:AcrR family transcriptional regulator